MCSFMELSRMSYDVAQEVLTILKGLRVMFELCGLLEEKMPSKQKECVQWIVFLLITLRNL